METVKANLNESQPMAFRLTLRARRVYDQVADELGTNRRGAIELAARLISRLHQESGKSYEQLFIKDSADGV